MDGLAQWSAAWAPYFGVMVVQNTVFLVIVFIALHFLRNASAQTRYVVATAGLLKLILPPFVSLRVLPVFTDVPSPLGESLVTLVRGGQPSAVPTREVVAMPDVFSVLFVIWLTVVIGYVGLSLFRTYRISRALKDAVPLGGFATGAASWLPTIEVFESDKIAMPLTVGVFPRKIFVPAAWHTWSLEFRRAVIRHEAAHIARFDGLVQLAQTLAGALYFFHPLVWTLNRRLGTYREMACDDSSVGDQRLSRLDYSRSLVQIAERSVRDPLACESVSTLLRRKHEVLDRVRYQTKEGVMRSVPRRKLAIVLALLVCCVVPLSWHLGGAAPQSTAGAKKMSGEMLVVEVHIKNATSIRIDNKKATLQGFEAEFERAVDRAPDKVVTHLDCAADLPMSVLFEVQDILVRNGFTKVKYANGQDGGLPLVLPVKEMEKQMETIPAEHISNVYVDRGEVVFEDKKVTAGELDGLVARRLQEDPYVIVSIHAKPDATYSDFVTVLRQVKAGRVQRIFISQPPM